MAHREFPVATDKITTMSTRKANELLPAKYIEQLKISGVVRSYPRHSIIINEADDTEGLYIILEGAVEIYVSSDDGKKLILNMLGPGEYFGEIALDGGPRSASAAASTAVKLMVVMKRQLDDFLLENPDFAVHLVHKLRARVRALTEDAKSFALLDVYGRVARFLNSKAQIHNGRPFVEGRHTHQEIAEFVGSSREMVTRILKDLREGGYLRIADNGMYIERELPKHW